MASILLIDGNPIARAARALVIRELQHTVIASCDVDEGLTMLARNDISAVVASSAIQDASSNAAVERLRRAQPDIPIILISGYADMLDLESASTGADVVIQKSSHELAELTRAIKRVLHQRAGSRTSPASSLKTRTGT